jgi:hypothetical protein
VYDNSENSASGTTAGQSRRDRLRRPAPVAGAGPAKPAAPRAVTLCGKRPDLDITLPRPDGTFTMRTGTGAHSFIAMWTKGQRARSTLEPLRE